MPRGVVSGVPHGQPIGTFKVYCGDRPSTLLSEASLRFLLLFALWFTAPVSPAVADAFAQQESGVPDSIVNFSELVARLSEAGGYFDTDNLISNEASYLHIVSALERHRVRGGIFIGVGPDQNFSYIAAIRPQVAFMLDIRRDNMLQHLLFKALFANAPTRAAYLALWLGRPAPPSNEIWRNAAIEQIVAWMDSTPPTSTSTDAALSVVRRAVQQSGIPLSADDLATIERFHRTFINAGLSLQFTSTGRPPRWYYPTLRQLLLERDVNGQRRNYLARDADYQFLRTMQRRNLVVPVVGDLGGTHALPAIATWARQHGAHVTAMYVSNAEDYLIRGGSFATYARSVASLPRASNGVIIRSWFGGPQSHPHSVDGYYSTQLLQSIGDFVAMADKVTWYRDLANQSRLR